ncbi:MAG: PQQ-dependent sugar dehydrogenase [Terriglobales bacterium]
MQDKPVTFESESARYRVEVVAKGLEQPSAMIFLPDGRALLAERRSGRVDLLDVHTGALTPVEGVPPTVLGNDSGLHDLVLHPDFTKNGWIYLSYSDGEADRSTTVVDRMRLRGNTFVDRERVFTADSYSEDRYHFGGRMVFLDGFLFLTIGDRHHEGRAQELSNHAGTIVRLHDDGRVPADNPLVGQKSARPEIWSYGHRNPQGLVVMPGTNELWSNEHGPLGGDELNIIRRGANYGWPVISYGWQYSGGPIGQGLVRQEGMEQPIWVWTPALAPSGLIVYTGSKFPAWRGNLFIGSMSQRHLNRLVVRDGNVVLEERLMYQKAGRVRMVAQGPDGFIYIGNDDGQILRLRPAGADKP